MKKIVFLLTFLSFNSIHLLSQVYGTLDPTFHGNGKLQYNSGGQTDRFNDVKIQDDQKIVATGGSITSSTSIIKVIRVLPNGSMDPSFGTAGVFTLINNAGECYAYDSYILDDGKILVCGTYYFGPSSAMALFRLNSNGTLDTSFGSDGIITTDTSSHDDIAYSMAVQPNGQILVAGKSDFPCIPTVARFSANGILDLTFGVNGITQIPIKAINNEYNSIVLQPDGKIIAAGYWAPDTWTFGILATRFNTDGSIDNSFGIHSSGAIIPPMPPLVLGCLYYPITGNRCASWGMLLKDDGRFLITGSVDNGADGFVLQLDSDGTPDINFGSSFSYAGVSIFDKGGDAGFSDIALQADGKIICAGQRLGDFLLVRYDAIGNYDKSFGKTYDGITTTFFLSMAAAKGIAIQRDGKIVLAGPAIGGAGKSDYTIARYINKINDVLSVPSEPIVPSLVSIWPTIVSKDQPISITCELKNDAETKIEIYNLLGDKIAFIDAGIQRKGNFQTQVQLPSDINAGVYFLCIENKGYSTESFKIIVTK